MKRMCSLLVVLALALGGCASSGARVAADESPTVEVATPVPRTTPAATPTPRSTRGATAAPTPVPTPSPEPAPVSGQAPTGPTQRATVVSVTDGDTIRVLIDGDEYPVRYIGIDTPETRYGVEWMGPEASMVNAELVAGREVILEKDVSETDQYGRLLRHVWVDRGADGLLLVNLELLRRGMAQVATYPPDVKYVDSLYLAAQREARDAGIGLWGAVATPTPGPAAPLPVMPSTCEPSYPDVCIPIGAADLDCGDIDARRFSVLWNVANPDPHRFDADADGIGCES